jgi:O-antigen/teichoic acid export membrane protein
MIHSVADQPVASMQRVAEPRRSVLVRGARGGAVYTFAGLVQRGLPLLLLPIYARVLSPEQYGQVALVLAAGALLGAFLGFGLEAAVLRAAIRLKGDPDERYRFINTLGLFAVVTPVLGSLVAGFAAAALLGTAHPIPLDVLLVGFLAVAVQTSVTVFVGALLRAEERLHDYARVTVAYAVTNVAVTVALVVGLRLGPIGWLVGNLAASLVSLGYGLALLGHRWSRAFAWTHLQAALLFGIPLLPHTVSHWMLNVSDRLVLGAFVTASDVGIYNLAYQLAAGAALVVVAAHQGAMPVYAEASTSVDIRRELGRVATYQVHLTALVGLAVILLGPAVIAVAFPPSYAVAGTFLPWIALGYVLFGLYLIPMDSLSVMVGKTRWLWIPTALAAAINVGLNLIFVPRYGAAAAAVDTAIAYGILLVGVTAMRQLASGPRVPYAVENMAAGIAIAGGVGLAAIWAIPVANDIGSLLGRGVFVLVAAVGIFAIERRPWHPTRSRLELPRPTSNGDPEAPAPAPERASSLTRG